VIGACNAGVVRLRCLLVDDNVEFLEAARRLLERQGISIVAVATTSEEARRQFRELQPDVVLVDVNLGTESGFDLARELAASPRGSPTRVILISTYAEPDFGDALSAGASIQFLSKSELSGTAVRTMLGIQSDGDAAG
jgi:CheY-like chemotaxis protein